jgi:hypothetical protein
MNSIRSNSGKIALLAFCAAATTVAQGAAATSTLPTYPGATKVPTHSTPGFSMCGHKVGLVSYDTATNGKSVAKWYESKVPNAVVLDTSHTDSSSVDTEIQVYTSDGSEVAVIHQLSMTNTKLQSAAKSIGADKTGIGLETFEPPLGADFVSLMIRAKGGDTAAKSALAAKCPKN